MEITVIVASAAVSLGLVGLLWAIAGERSAPSPRQLGVETTDLRTIELRKGFGNRAMAPLIRWLSIRARRFTPIGLVESLDRKISLAGLRERLSLERALALKFIITAVGAAFGLFDLINERPFRGIAVMVLGYFAMDIILWSRARERQAEIQKALPDTMDQLRISVEAGLAFDAAVDRVSRREGPLAREFALVGSDIQLGASRNEAFKNLISRTDVPDLRRFVAAVTHAEAFGVSISQVLSAQSDDLRDKRRTRAQEKAQRIPILIIFPMLVFIFPTIFVVLLGPAAMKIFDTLLNF